MKWLPWRTVLRRVARAHGFLDPFSVMARLQRFAQPSEVSEPIELLRAGVTMHARGLINAKAIQHNLDWVWPYWVERQFDPEDEAFVPRAFSLTHINLTHRNWTAVGLPDLEALPVVDPRGLVTPLHDGWSVDGWVLEDGGEWLLPSRAREDATQHLDLADGIAVLTRSGRPGLSLESRAMVVEEAGGAVCLICYRAQAAAGGWLVLALRPFNPEGVSSVDEVEVQGPGDLWRINGEPLLRFSEVPEAWRLSDYRAGDVFLHLPAADPGRSVDCPVGMATAAACYRLDPARERGIELRVPLERDARPAHRPTWNESLEGACRLRIPDERCQALYDQALRTLVLLSPRDVYPGPYTYKRFWFRDAAFMINALLGAGLMERAARALESFPQRQKISGFFHSQDGEWDSNGAALWILHRVHALRGRPADADLWLRPVRSGARWILRKRLAEEPVSPHAGLLPPGFSAEHLGPNDYYYWDDFWAVAGLRAAAALCRDWGEMGDANEFRAGAERLLACIEASLAGTAERLGRPAMPASPYRRLDAGAIGSLVAGYPLQIFGPRDPRLLDSVEFLLDQCLVDGGFFQDMIHSGINAYLSLHMAQVLLRAGDERYRGLMDTVARLASPTGQWPEAIHPRTLGGCMGDGQHGWAAAEWLLMLRACFVREEDDGLVLGAGVPRDWLAAGEPLEFGPTPTPYGPLSIAIDGTARRPRLRWSGAWHGEAPRLRIELPGFAPALPPATAGEVVLDAEDRP